MKKIIMLVCIAAALVSCAGGHDNGLTSEQNSKVSSLLKEMTLEEKVGQMNLCSDYGDFTALIDFDDLTEEQAAILEQYKDVITGPMMQTDLKDDIRNGLCGNVLGATSAARIRELQRVAVEESRLGIPVLFGLDVIHGFRTTFPIPLAESCSWDLDAIALSASTAAREAQAAGVSWTYAPMVDISVEPRWGRVSEGAGEDAYLGSRIAEARVRGFQGDDLASVETIAACVKHFAGYGAPQAGREYNTVDMSERWFREFYLPTYKAAVGAGAQTVMTSFNELDGVPATGNTHLLRDILRDEWGFGGFVVTDYTSINEMVNHGVVSDEKEAGEKAVNAGVDMDLQGHIYAQYLVQSVREGKVSEKTIDDAVRRILEVKMRLGLFDDPYRYCDPEREAAEELCERNLDAAREVATKSMVLLKNNGVLPLKRGERIAVIGDLASSQRDLLGPWSVAGDETAATTFIDAFREYTGGTGVTYVEGCKVESEDRSGFPAAMAAASRADKVVMVIGENCDMSGEAGSRADIRIPGVQSELLAKIAATGKPVVVVLFNGRPLDISEESETADAILEAWFPGTMGGKAISQLLYGEVNPSGKLTMTFPRALGQVPIYYYAKNTGRPNYLPDPKFKSRYLDMPNGPLYPFGYGLSYTHFTYSDIALSSESFSRGGGITVSATVTNDGPVAGAEIAQFYIRDLVGSVTRPVRQLRGFEKIWLEPGESRTISFNVDEETISFYRADMSWGPEPGDFHAFVGGSSADTDLLQTSFRYE